MSYSLDLEHDLLKYLHDWPHDPDGPSGAAPIVNPETLLLIPFFEKKERKTQAEVDKHWRILESHLKTARECGWVSGTPYKNGWGKQTLTPAGHERIDWHYDRSKKSKFIRFLATTFGVAITSIALPVTAAILTVLVINYLGLGGENHLGLGGEK